jgi:Fe-S-cluster-containing dehydrogenase component
MFGDLDDPNSEVSKLLRENSWRVLKQEVGTKPNVYYINQFPRKS